MNGPTLVQYNDGDLSSSQIAFLPDVTEGDMLVVMTPGNLSVSDSLGNSYSDFGYGLADIQAVRVSAIASGGWITQAL